MTAAIAPSSAPTCPRCGGVLQRLAGADGYMVERCLSVDGRGSVEKRRIHAIYACNRCEFAGVKDGAGRAPSDDRPTNRRRAGAA